MQPSSPCHSLQGHIRSYSTDMNRATLLYKWLEIKTSPIVLITRTFLQNHVLIKQATAPEPMSAFLPSWHLPSKLA